MAATRAFYVAGGTMPPDAPCYVERAADQELFTGLRQGEFCYVLTSRQMGKSSLMVRTATRLREAGVAVAVLDVTAIGQNLTVEQWYQGLLGRVGRQLELEEALESYWLQHPDLAPLQRFMGAMEQVVLPGIGRSSHSGRAAGFDDASDGSLPELPSLVVFIDEIDFVRSLPFPTDELFAAIRECYNRRAAEPELRRLTFCLLGVASPADLIQDPRSTPFNIGRRIELTDFTAAEARPLAAGLLAGSHPTTNGKGAEQLLARVIAWTGGQPYLTQRLCGAVCEELGGAPPARLNGALVVDTVCRRLFLAPGSERRDDNLLFVRERVLRGDADSAAVLELYQRVWAGGRVPVDEASAAQETLRLAGLVDTSEKAAFWSRGSQRGAVYLTPRNRIYQRVFDRRWVRENMPDAELRRQRVAYRRGLFRAATVGTAIVIALGTLAAAAIHNERRANGLADSYRSMLGQKEAALRKLGIALQDVEQERRSAHREATRAQFAETRERGQRTAAEHERNRAELQALLARTNGAEAQQERDDSRRRLLRLLVQNGTQAREEGDLSLALLWFVEALKRDERDPALAEIHRLRIADLLRFCPRVIHVWQRSSALTATAMSPDGTRAAAAWADGVTRLWNVQTGKEVGTSLTQRDAILCLTFSPDGKHLLTGGRDQTARLWDAYTGRPIAVPLRHTGAVHHVAFSRNGSRLLTASNDDTRVWVTATGQPAGPLIHTDPGLFDVQLSPDGMRVVIAVTGRSTRVWAVDTGLPVTRPLRHDQTIQRVCFSPDGRYVATASYDYSARVWDAATGVAITPPLLHENAVVGVQFSPDGGRLVTNSSDRTARIWDARSGAPGAVLRHAVTVNSATFSPDGARVLTSSDDGLVHVWNALTGEAAAPLLRHSGPIYDAIRDSSERWLMTASAAGAVQVWDMAAGPDGCLPEEPVTGGKWSRLGPDGASGFTIRDYELGVLWRWQAGTRTKHLLQLGKYVAYAELSPDGQYLVTGGGMAPEAWNARTGEKRWRGNPSSGPTTCAVFSPDSTRLAVGGTDGRVQVWETASGRPCFPPLIHRGCVNSLAFSPDGNRLAAIVARLQDPRTEGRLSVWALASRKRLSVDGAGRDDLRSAEFSRDSRLLVSASTRAGARVWDLETGLPRTPLLHTGAVLRACFSPDGEKVVTAGTDGTARIWSAVNGRLLAPPLKHVRPVLDASFSPDGLLVLTRAAAEIQVWSSTTGEAVTAPVHLPPSCERARFTAPRQVVAEMDRGTILRWHLPTLTQPTNALETLALLSSGQQLGEELTSVAVSPRSLPRQLTRLRQLIPETVFGSKEREAVWQAQELDRSERSKQWSVALAHAGQLSRLRPYEWGPLVRHGTAYAELDRWGLAAVDLQRAIKLGADDRLIWYRLALAQLAAGDSRGFEVTSQRMLDRFAESPDPREPDLATWTRALGPGTAETARRALGIFHRHREGTIPDGSTFGSLGGLQVRAGQYEEAVSALQQAISLRQGVGTVPDHLFLALAYAQLSQARSAQAALANARALINRAQVEGDPLSWEDRVEQQVLLREVEERLRTFR